MTPAGQRWTHNTPTEPGFYWYRNNDTPTIVHVEEWPEYPGSLNGQMYAFFSQNRGWGRGLAALHVMHGEFLGPLTPNEATE